MSKIPTIELFIKDEANQGVFAISLVEEPAIEENFIALGKHEVQLKAINDERKIAVGFALIPNKEIYRRQKVGNDIREFNIVLSNETVAKSQELFMKNLHNNKFTSQHEKDVQGVSVIESWIVEDVKNDKSNHYGLKPKGGEWVIMTKFYNEDEYAKIKNGEYKGYSIEASYDGFDQLPAKEPTILEQIKEILKTNKLPK